MKIKILFHIFFEGGIILCFISYLVALFSGQIGPEAPSPPTYSPFVSWGTSIGLIMAFIGFLIGIFEKGEPNWKE